MPTDNISPGGSWTVPSGVFEIEVELEGHAGEDAGYSSYTEYYPPGDGGTVRGLMPVEPGATLYIRSSPGGGSNGQAGGDSIDIRYNGTALTDRVAVAAGGGGGGMYGEDNPYNPGDHYGGDGGGTEGQDGERRSTGASGTGATLEYPGIGGNDEIPGSNGGFGPGGDGAGLDEPGGDGGGGGAGAYGGGGGASINNTQGPSSGEGGGGGTNYVGGLSTVYENSRGSSFVGYDDSNDVEITYNSVSVGGLNVDAEAPTSIDMSWNAPPLPSGASLNGYNVYRAETPGNDRNDYTQIGSTSSGTRSYTDSGLANGKQYYYRVGATFNYTASGGPPAIPPQSVFPVDTFEQYGEDYIDLEDFWAQGSPSSFTTSTFSKVGNRALERSGSDNDYLSSGTFDGLRNYPSRGNTVRMWWYQGSSGDNSYFGFDMTGTKTNDEGDGYLVSLNPSANEVLLQKVDSEGGTYGYGQTTTLASNTSVSFAGSGWHDVVVEYDLAGNGDIRVVVEDPNGSVITDITGNDTTFNNQGVTIGHGSNDSNSTQRFDHIRLEPYNG